MYYYLKSYMMFLLIYFDTNVSCPGFIKMHLYLSNIKGLSNLKSNLSHRGPLNCYVFYFGTLLYLYIISFIGNLLQTVIGKRGVVLYCNPIQHFTARI